jgi:MoxR-like ATPase
MPSDITGTDIIQEDASGKRQMVFSPGPIFANIVLADEINRTPPKTQSALLEAMQEHRVTIQGRTYILEEPFHVFATQNRSSSRARIRCPKRSSTASCSTSSSTIRRKTRNTTSCARRRRCSIRSSSVR